MHLNDTHLVLLSAAAQRSDGLLVRPDKLRGRAAEHTARRLEAAGLVEAVQVGAQDPHWRTSEAGASIGLRLLPAGAKAIGVEVDGGQQDDAGDQGTKAAVPTASSGRGAKRSAMIVLLQRSGGASIADIVQATGWLPHSTRAALTGLRKAGHHIDRSTSYWTDRVPPHRL